MKVFLRFLLLVFIGFAITACSNDKPKENKEQKTFLDPYLQDTKKARDVANTLDKDAEHTSQEVDKQTQ